VCENPEEKERIPGVFLEKGSVKRFKLFTDIPDMTLLQLAKELE
jgi:hypothetical protein